VQQGFRFAVEDIAFEVTVEATEAPRTAAAVLAHLPAEADLHCAKIAGNHIFWHAPFVEPLEGARSVLDLPAGSFLYWPDRQFLELIYAPLQAERAQVTPLGRMVGSVEPLLALGQRVIETQGLRPLVAELTPLNVPPAEIPPPKVPALAEIRTAVWQAEPAEIGRLLRRQGIMLPLGPLLMAEAEFRKLQEFLWELLMHETDEAFVRQAAGRMLSLAHSRIDGLCGLHAAGRALTVFAEAVEGEPALAAVLEETILYSGRMAAWLDLRIPWQPLHEAMLGARARAEETAP